MSPDHNWRRSPWTPTKQRTDAAGEDFYDPALGEPRLGWTSEGTALESAISTFSLTRLRGRGYHRLKRRAGS
jgi:hypothetical protein